MKTKMTPILLFNQHPVFWNRIIFVHFFGLFGILLCLGLYALIGFHFYAFIVVVCPLIKLRLGTEMGLTWIAVGLAILYNIVFNHFWAMVIKPGSSKD